MTNATILHNPRCSKSRQTLQLLEENQCDITVVEYLKKPLDKQQLSTLMSQLGIDDARLMMRTKEAEYKEQSLSDDSVDNEALLSAIANTPKLLERPIVVVGNQARIGRPPESVLELL